MKIFGMDFSCALDSLSKAQFPEKDCLLPLISKLLGYSIVAASTTVKLPQGMANHTFEVEIVVAVIQNHFMLVLNLKQNKWRIRVPKTPPSSNSSASVYMVTWGEPMVSYSIGLNVMILKILKHRSVRGLSVLAFELEVVGYTIALAYCLHKSLPFSAFGEYVFLLVQAIILVAIIYYYSQPVGIKTWIKALLYCAVAPTVLAGQVDPVLFEALYASQHAIFLFARIPQIWANFTNKSTGQLSFLTFFMNFAGSIARVFTSIQVKAPASVVLGSLIGMMTNGTILTQIAIYQKPPAKEKKIE